MQILCSCAILCSLVLNIWCEGPEKKDWNITFDPQIVTAVPGVCALISCTFIYPDNGKVNILLRKCKKLDKCVKIFNWKTDNQNLTEIENKTHIKILEPDLTKNNCSIIIENVKAEDETEYEWKPNKSSSINRVKIIIQDKPTVNVPDLTEGVQASLSCLAPFPCPRTPPEITWWIMIRVGSDINPKANNITLNTFKSFYQSTLTFTPTSDLHNATVRCDVAYESKTISTSRTLEVLYVQTLQILGDGKVKEGDTLRLKCTVESHPPSTDPVWTFTGTSDQLKNQTFGESLVITNVGQEHAGVYVCEMTYMNKTLNASIFIEITGATKQVKTNEALSPTGESMPDRTTGIEDFFKNLDTPKILTFVAGIACSAFIFSVILCCMVCCHRRKKRKLPIANPDVEVNLETVQANVAQTGTNEQTPLHGQHDGEIPNTAAPADEENEAEENEAVGTEPRETDYASINYSLLKNRPPEEKQMETTDTEYAEIKRHRRRDETEEEALQDDDDQIETSNQIQMEGEEELDS